MLSDSMIFFFSSRRRHTRCALVTGVQTCALPISLGGPLSLSCGRDWTEDTLTRAFSCHRLSWRRLRRQAAALICRVWGLFLPPAARARPSPPLPGSAWRSGGFPLPSLPALLAARVLPPPPARPRLRLSPPQRRPIPAH